MVMVTWSTLAGNSLGLNLGLIGKENECSYQLVMFTTAGELENVAARMLLLGLPWPYLCKSISLFVIFGATSLKLDRSKGRDRAGNDVKYVGIGKQYARHVGVIHSLVPRLRLERLAL